MVEITWINILFIYVVTWSVLLFVMLPIGVQSEENVESGHSTGAPKKAYVSRKILATTVASVLVTWGIVLLLQSGIIPIRDVQ